MENWQNALLFIFITVIWCCELSHARKNVPFWHQNGNCIVTINLHQNTCHSLIGPCIIHINIDMRYMPLMPLIFILRISTNRVFSRFQSWADELFVKWIMECHQYHASLNSNISHYVNMTRVCVMCDFPISLLMNVLPAIEVPLDLVVPTVRTGWGYVLYAYYTWKQLYISWVCNFASAKFVRYCILSCIISVGARK